MNTTCHASFFSFCVPPAQVWQLSSRQISSVSIFSFHCMSGASPHPHIIHTCLSTHERILQKQMADYKWILYCVCFQSLHVLIDPTDSVTPMQSLQPPCHPPPIRKLPPQVIFPLLAHTGFNSIRKADFTDHEIPIYPTPGL